MSSVLFPLTGLLGRKEIGWSYFRRGLGAPRNVGTHWEDKVGLERWLRQVRVNILLAEDPSLASNTHIRWLTITCKLSF